MTSDGTVHITPSVDESKLGVVTPQSKRRLPGDASFADDSIDISLTTSRNQPQLTLQPATPKVVPPTPEMNPVSSTPPVNFQSSDTSDFSDDVETDPKRRSLLRSPGTSSSPDLATLVRKAKERGGIVGADKMPGDSKPSLPLQVQEPRSPSAVRPPASAYLTPTSHPRNRAASSSSSSFCVVSPASSPAPRTEPMHSKKGGKSSLAPMPNNASMLSLSFGSKDKDPKVSIYIPRILVLS